jgi:hypothetical protein
MKQSLQGLFQPPISSSPLRIPTSNQSLDVPFFQLLLGRFHLSHMVLICHGDCRIFDIHFNVCQYSVLNSQFSIESHDSLLVPLVVLLRSLERYFKTLFFSTYLSIVQHTPAIATIPWQSMDHALILFYFLFVIYVVDSKPT